MAPPATLDMDTPDIDTLDTLDPPDNPDTLDTYQGLVGAFADFLVVAIHTILYERGVYPRESFLSARKYNYPVRQNRHPKVCRWVADAVSAVEAELLKVVCCFAFFQTHRFSCFYSWASRFIFHKVASHTIPTPLRLNPAKSEKGTVSRVAVVIYSPASQPLERFVFDLSSFPAVPPSEATTPFEDPSSSVSFIDLAEQFRGAMQKLAFCDSTLAPLPANCSFTVCIELKPDGEAPIGQSSTPWIPSQPLLQPHAMGENQGASGVTNSSTIGKGLGGIKTTPIRTLEAGAFLLEVWVEEGKAKASSSSDPANRR
ncbi:MAG: hypothetical protein M1839_003405 [Geoglossum umbratile]|nr:MAG: hypothetical protein M1839_003405 [Geoglossum umbratile]